jgi:hypothetical protein
MRRFAVLLLIAALGPVGAGLAGAQSGTRKAAPTEPGTSASAPAPAQPARVAMPPVPNLGFPPGRPVDQARAVYEFAAQHPEVLKYVPCYCGCESTGHPHNESCFVRRRDARGNVLEWDTHGYG